MNRFATILVAVGFATAGSTALADQAKDQLSEQQNAKPQPVQMSEAQLDNVVAGQIQVGSGLVTVQVGDVAVDIPVRVLNNSVNNNQVQVPVAAGIGAGVLGQGVGGGVAGAFGRNN